VRVRLFAGKWNPQVSALKRACRETKRLKSLAARPLSGQCNPNRLRVGARPSPHRRSTVTSGVAVSRPGQRTGSERSARACSVDRTYPQRMPWAAPPPTTSYKGSGDSANFDLPIRVSNDELERPSAVSDRALCAHNDPGAHSAPPQLSRPLQALVRNPPHRKLLCACGYSTARGIQWPAPLSAPDAKRRDRSPLRYGNSVANESDFVLARARTSIGEVL
jgi:hypothetical protein